MTLRVLIVSHLYPSPTRPTEAPWLRDQVDELAVQGVEIDVLCCSPFEAGGDFKTRPNARVDVHYRSTSAGPLDGTRPGLAVSALRYRWELRRFLRDRSGHYDLVHAHFAFPDGWATAHAAARAGLPFLLTVHGSDVTQVLAASSGLGRLTRQAALRAARVICVSTPLENEVRSALGGSARTAVISNGYDDTLFHVRDTPRDLGFVYAGRLHEVKGVSWLLDTYLANPRLHDTPLTIIGDGPLRPGLERSLAAAPPEAAARVTLLGALPHEQVADACSRARAVIVPSQREGWGAVAAEALACGTPVAGARVGGLPSILAGEAAGVLFEPGDTAGLLDAMQRVRAWPHDARAVAAANGACPWPVEARRIADIYEEVAGERS